MATWRLTSGMLNQFANRAAFLSDDVPKVVVQFARLPYDYSYPAFRMCIHADYDRKPLELAEVESILKDFGQLEAEVVQRHPHLAEYVTHFDIHQYADAIREYNDRIEYCRFTEQVKDIPTEWLKRLVAERESTVAS